MEEDIKMVKKAGGKLATMPIDELISYRQACDIVVAYYTNLAEMEKADKNGVEMYQKLNNYIHINQMIFDEINKRIDNI